MATVTALWTQEQYEPGATIICNFTWSGAVYCSDDSCYGRCTIEDAYGNELASARRQTASGSYFLNMPASAGTYVGKMYIWDLSVCRHLISAEDTCLVQSTTNYTLTLVNSPSNTYGSIELIGHGTCPSTCSYLLPAQSYSIEAHSNPGYVFSYWSTTPSGGCTSSSPTCMFTLNGNKTITAHFIVGSVNLTRSKSCDSANQSSYCFYGSNPPQKDAFECYETALVFSQIDSGVLLDGKTWLLEWWHSAQATPVNTWSIPMSGGYTGWWSCYPLNPCSPLGSGTCHIKHYIDNVYIGSSNTFIYNQPPGTVIGLIDEAGSNFYTGPFNAGQQQAPISYIYLGNNGNTSGTVYAKYFYKNSSETWVALNATAFSVDISSGAWIYQNHSVDIPSTIQSGQVQFGVKVWGATETEPATLSLMW